MNIAIHKQQETLSPQNQNQNKNILLVTHQ